MIFFKKNRIIKTDKLKFIDLNQFNCKFFNDLGLDNYKKKDFEKAIYYFSKAIEIQPNNYTCYLNRAETYWKICQYSLALYDLKKSWHNGSAEAKNKYKEYLKIYKNFKDQNKSQLILLDEIGINHLYHITHISNFESIMENGLTSHNFAHSSGLINKDISDQLVNNRRQLFHDYVPFYFNPKNPMLYKRKNIQDDLIIIAIDRRKLFENDIKITDGNAASKGTNFYDSFRDLDKLNWHIIRSDYWSDFYDGKRIRCAEILIPQKVPITDIEIIYCRSQQAKSIIESLIKNYDIKIIVEPDLYF